MFERRHQVTVIAEGLNISGDVTAEGMVEMHGQIEGELKCTSLRVTQRGRGKETIISEDVVVNGIVDGPIYGTHVALESKANVTGNIHHESLSIERGASFDGRSLRKNKPARITSTESAGKKGEAEDDVADAAPPPKLEGAEARTGKAN